MTKGGGIRRTEGVKSNFYKALTVFLHSAVKMGTLKILIRRCLPCKGQSNPLVLEEIVSVAITPSQRQ